MKLDAPLTTYPATIEDIPELLPFLHGINPDLGWGPELKFARLLHKTEKGLEEEITATNSIFLKCLNEKGKIIGCVQGETRGEAFFVASLTVMPNAEGKGMGAKLMEVMEIKAKENGCNVVKVEVVPACQDVVEWYEKKGYVKTGNIVMHQYKHPEYPGAELPFIELAKPI